MNPHAEWRQSVFDGFGDQGGDGDRACFADAFDAEGVQRAWRFDVRYLDLRHFDGSRHQKVHKAGIDELATVVEEEMLVERTADPLGDAPVNLTLDDGRVDDHPTVVHDDVAQEAQVTRRNVNFDDGRVLPAGPGRPLRREKPEGLQARLLPLRQNRAFARFDQAQPSAAAGREGL